LRFQHPVGKLLLVAPLKHLSLDFSCQIPSNLELTNKTVYMFITGKYSKMAWRSRLIATWWNLDDSVYLLLTCRWHLFLPLRAWKGHPSPIDCELSKCVLLHNQEIVRFFRYIHRTEIENYLMKEGGCIDAL
jgi:hypothetical protein